MVLEQIVKDEIKDLEQKRSKLIREYSELVSYEDMNYDLNGDRIMNKLSKKFKDIEDISIQLKTLYRIQSKC